MGAGKSGDVEFFNGDRVSVLQDEKVLERNDGDGCIVT